MKKFLNTFYGTIAKLSLNLTVIFSVSYCLLGYYVYLSGIWAAFLWCLANSVIIYYLMNLVKQGAMNSPKERQKVILICVLKFPTLYLIGFLFLLADFVSNMGILIGFTVYLLVAVLVVLKIKLVDKRQVIL